MPRSVWQVTEDGAGQQMQVLVFPGRYLDHGVVFVALAQPLVTKRATGRFQVELVQDEDSRLGHVRDQLGGAPVLGTDRAGRIHNMNHQVDSFQGVANAVMQVLDELTRLGFENAGRVDEHDLAVGCVHDPVVGVAGGLRPWRHDRHLGPNQGIEQGRLADVGAPNQHHQPGLDLRGVAH